MREVGGERREVGRRRRRRSRRRDVGMIHKDEEAKREADERVDEGSRSVERWGDGEKGSEEREKEEGGKRRKVKEGRASASKEKKE